MVTDLPYKIMNALITNIILYFMTNLKREAGAFFYFLWALPSPRNEPSRSRLTSPCLASFVAFILTLTMSVSQGL